MGRLLTGLGGAFGLAWLWRFLRREQPPPQAPQHDPAVELRAKLEQAREAPDDRDEFDAAEGQPVDEVERPPAPSSRCPNRRWSRSPSRTGARDRRSRWTSAAALCTRRPSRRSARWTGSAATTKPTGSGHGPRMRIVVVGATGNVGTSVLDALARDDAVESILGLARRRPTADYAKTEFAAADVTRDDLVPHFRGADCVIHLAWLIQPSRDERTLRETNVEGSARVLEAVAGGGRPRARRRLLDRRLLARAEGAGRRELAAGGRADELVLAPQGRAGAAARRLRGGARRARRPPAAGADHEARERRRGAAALHRPLPAEPARQARPATRLPPRPGRDGPGRALAGRGRGVSARRHTRRPRGVQRRRGAGARREARGRGDRRPRGHDPGRRARVRSPPRAGMRGCSPPPRTGSTSRSGCRCSTARGRARSWAGRPRGTGSPRFASSCSAWPSVRAAGRRLCAPATASPRSRPASAENRSEQASSGRRHTSRR